MAMVLKRRFETVLFRRMSHGACVVAALLLMSGCAGALRKPAPNRRTFLFEATPQQESAEAPVSGRVLRVHRASAAPPYQTKQFVYRRKDDLFATDFYNGFLVLPAETLAEEVTRWLRHSGLFAIVSRDTDRVLPDCHLETRVEALYVDMRPVTSEAVLQLRFLLTDSRDDVLLVKTYAASRAVGEQQGAGARMAAWNEALQDILTQFESDVRERLQGRTK